MLKWLDKKWSRWQNRKTLSLPPPKWSESESCRVMSNSLGPHGYTVHGILQARILEWVAVPFSKGSCQPRDRTLVSCIAGVFFTSWTTKGAHLLPRAHQNYNYLQSNIGKIWKLAEKMFYNWKHKVTKKHIRGVETGYGREPHLQVGTTNRIITNAEVTPQGAPHQAP